MTDSRNIWITIEKCFLSKYYGMILLFREVLATLPLTTFWQMKMFKLNKLDSKIQAEIPSLYF
jgi:hypothetical protein